MTSKLTAKQKAFIKQYLIDGNATRSAIAAGYSAKTAYAAGSRLLKHVQVDTEINKQVNKRSEKLELTADYVLGSIRDIAERCKLTMPMAAIKAYELLGKHLKLFTDVTEERGAKDLNFGNIPSPVEFNQPGTADKPN